MATEKKSSSAEVDFVIPFHNKVIPVEVKAGAPGTLKSLHYFVKEKKASHAVRFCSSPPNFSDVTTQVQQETITYKLLTLPFYLSGQLSRLLESVS